MLVLLSVLTVTLAANPGYACPGYPGAYAGVNCTEALAGVGTSPIGTADDTQMLNFDPDALPLEPTSSSDAGHIVPPVENPNAAHQAYLAANKEYRESGNRISGLNQDWGDVGRRYMAARKIADDAIAAATAAGGNDAALNAQASAASANVEFVAKQGEVDRKEIQDKINAEYASQKDYREKYGAGEHGLGAAILLLFWSGPGDPFNDLTPAELPPPSAPPPPAAADDQIESVVPDLAACTTVC